MSLRHRCVATTAAVLLVSSLGACTESGAEPTEESQSSPVESSLTSPSPSADFEAAVESPQLGVPWSAGGLEFTIGEPEDVPSAERWEGTIDTELYPDEMIFPVSVTNATAEVIEVAGSIGFDTFSGTHPGEYLSCESDVLPPSRLQPGRSAEWPECFAVEDADDIVFTIYPPDDGPAIDYFIGSPQMDEPSEAPRNSGDDPQEAYVLMVQDAGEPLVREYPDLAPVLDDSKGIVTAGEEMCTQIDEGMTLDEVYLDTYDNLGLPAGLDDNMLFANFIWDMILAAPETLCPEHQDAVAEWEASAH